MFNDTSADVDKDENTYASTADTMDEKDADAGDVWGDMETY
jgi:hypothetical protein